MPGPPPPPPPAGCPPPPMPAFAPPKAGKGSGDERSALLTAIRKQPKLNRVDKTLINDRSDPLATSKGSGSGKAGGLGGSSPTSGRGGGGGGGGVGGASMNGPPNGIGLGGLFQGGMPKLKSVSSRSNTNLTNGPDSAPASMVNHSNANSIGSSFGDIQQELRKRLNNDSRNTSRGPAPPAPSRNITNELSSLQSKNGYQINNKMNNSQSQHRKTQSNGNFNTLDSPTSRLNNNSSSTTASSATTPAKGNFGKPNLAPKPPVLEKPVNALSNGKLRKSNSVRLPSSPLSTATSLNPLSFATASTNTTGPSGFHQSHHHTLDHERSRTLGGSTPHLSQFKLRPINGRPTVPPPSIPAQKVKPPSHAPPPPPVAPTPTPAAPTTPLPAAPTHAPPPPPPHRSAHVPPVPTRAAPAVPSAAPAPPPRNSSMRPSPSTTAFESRYVFRPMSEFPAPMPFRNVEKVYSTARQAGKQQAPQPPSGGGGVHVAQPPMPQHLHQQHQQQAAHQQQLQLAGGHRLWESSAC